MRCRSWLTGLAPFLAPIVLAAVPAIAAAGRTPGSAPAATLLLPYFEVDLSDPDGMTTLFSVNNAGEEPIVAHVVVWTDWGIPTYSFDLALGPNDVQTLNLRDLFATGSVPETDGSVIEGCADPVAAPSLAAAGLAALRARHSGRPDPADGLCYGSEPAAAGAMVGYITVDAARTCAGAKTYFPGEQDYFFFEFGGVPLPHEPFVVDDNVLWGDLFYVAEGDDSAQGTELVYIPYDPDAAPGETFYRLFAEDGGDGRALLGSRYRGRFLNGGAFDGGTDLLVWLEPNARAAPVPCGERGLHIDICQTASLELFDEDGAFLSETEKTIARLAFRLPVGTEELPAPAPFGYFELYNLHVLGCVIIPVGAVELQAWVTPVMKAAGRFSVGLPATRIPPPPEP